LRLSIQTAGGGGGSSTRIGSSRASSALASSRGAPTPCAITSKAARRKPTRMRLSSSSTHPASASMRSPSIAPIWIVRSSRHSSGSPGSRRVRVVEERGDISRF